MSTFSCNHNRTDALSAGVLQGRTPSKAQHAAGEFRGSDPSQGNRRGDSCAPAHSQASDEDLVSAAQRGDQLAFVELCERYSFVTKNRILRILGNREDTEDALQDTLLRAYTRLTSFRRSCKFSTWLTAIGVNSALMIMRKRRVRRETVASIGNSDSGVPGPVDHPDPSLGPEGIYFKQQTILLVRREVQKLKPNLRAVVDHYYGLECSLEEAASALDISIAAAKTRLLRGRVRLRASLTRHGISRSRT